MEVGYELFKQRMRGGCREILVTLDCDAVSLPAGRNSLNAIRAYLETLALASQRVLAEFSVDGCRLDLSLPLDRRTFSRIDAVTLPLNELPLLLLANASQQVDRARASVEAALTLVLINNPTTARELWWSLASLAQGTRAHAESHAGRTLPAKAAARFLKTAPLAA